jgi:predicted CopG family antitoxin
MKGKELKTVHVSSETWRKLVELKLNLKLRSLDDVIRFLLERANLRSPEEIRRRILMWEDIMEKVYAALHSEKEDVSYLRNLLVQLGHIEDEVDILIDDPEHAAAIIKELKWVLGEEKEGEDG